MEPVLYHGDSLSSDGMGARWSAVVSARAYCLSGLLDIHAWGDGSGRGGCLDRSHGSLSVIFYTHTSANDALVIHAARQYAYHHGWHGLTLSVRSTVDRQAAASVHRVVLGS